VQTDELWDQVEPLLASHGYTLVELGVSRRRGTPLVTIVVHRSAGVSIADCEKVSLLVRQHPSLGTRLEEADVEVCSPGTDRQIRDTREYSIFRGRGIRILRKSGVWVRGRIEDAADGTVAVHSDGARLVVPTADIKRAFLDENLEVE
jgi:ribosome maturation factor RimP